jgi:thioredoxin reductase
MTGVFSVFVLKMEQPSIAPPCFSPRAAPSGPTYRKCLAADATKKGIIADPETEESSVPGVYVAGDASRDVLLIAVAIGEGAKAAVAINRALLKDQGLG